ncbi:MAG: RluA family pseudouridine synthase [Anaerolineales bacterium]
MTEKVLIFQFEESQSQRLDHFLVGHLTEHSRTYLQSLINNGRVKVNGKIARKSGMNLEGYQEIEVRIPPIEPSYLVPEDIPLDIIYEDKNVILVNKPAGMVVHPSSGHKRGTLVHAVLAHDPNIEGVGGVQRPGLIHRLDKNTSGVIVLAKNDYTHRYIQEQFKCRKVEKRYVALVDGKPPTPEGRIEAPIGRDPNHRQKMAIVSQDKGRMAVSEYSTLEAFNEHTLLEVRILTGRTHQIRLHMAFIKCPVVGDTVYGHRRSTLPISRHFLHAKSLGLSLPDQKDIQVFTAPLPIELNQILKTLRH